MRWHPGSDRMQRKSFHSSRERKLFGRRMREDSFFNYTAQCPFTAKYVPILQKSARNHGIPFLTRQITTAEEAQNAPTPFTMFSLFYNGMFVTHEILSEKKFEKILEGVK